MTHPHNPVVDQELLHPTLSKNLDGWQSAKILGCRV
jgi:hypothetical protein